MKIPTNDLDWERQRQENLRLLPYGRVRKYRPELLQGSKVDVCRAKPITSMGEECWLRKPK